MQHEQRLPRWVIPALIASIALTAVAILFLFWARGSAPTAIGPMPAFELTNQEGRVVRSADLKGKSLVVGLIFTNCTDICPVTTSRMKGLQEELRTAGLLGTDALLLSLSVDPQRDTPPVLKAYAGQYGADTATWHFLTGPVDNLRKVVVEGFLLGVEKVPDQHGGSGAQNAYEVIHSDRVVLVDPAGQIRATFRTEELDSRQIITQIRSFR